MKSTDNFVGTRVSVQGIPLHSEWQEVKDHFPLLAFVLTARGKKMMFTLPVREGPPSDQLPPRSTGCMGPCLSCRGCWRNAIRRRGCSELILAEILGAGEGRRSASIF